MKRLVIAAAIVLAAVGCSGTYAKPADNNDPPRCVLVKTDDGWGKTYDRGIYCRTEEKP